MTSPIPKPPHNAPALRQNAIQQVANWLRKCNILDTETTGVKENAEIVSAAIIDQDGTVLFHSLIKPVNPITEITTAIHGITNEMVADKPTWAEVHDEIARILNAAPLVVYNAQFDMRMMAQSAAKHGLPPIVVHTEVHCAMEAYAHFYGQWNEEHQSYRWQSLSMAMFQQDVDDDNIPHSALGDVNRTLALMRSMVKAD